jgi:hypothetical protein
MSRFLPKSNFILKSKPNSSLGFVGQEEGEMSIWRDLQYDKVI